MTAKRVGWLAVLLTVLVPGLAMSQGATESDSGDREASASEPLAESRVTKSGSIVIDGETVAYTATVGNIVMRDDEGKDKANFVYVSYERDGVEDRARRPVTFSFNGGPGSASVWVHMGAYGPRKAELSPEGQPLGPPPGRLVDNEFSILDVTDLVFIDPISTGFSRPAPGEDKSQFHGFTNDVTSVGEFIRLWVTQNDRWLSPKLLAGESYGTTRSAGLVSYLQDRYAMAFNGIVLISSVINWQTKVFNIGNDLPYPLILPTYTAIAWHHGKLPARYDGDLGAAIADARTFALGDYNQALMLGDKLVGEQRRATAQRLSELSGLSVDYLEQSDLRVEISRFVKELRRGEGLTVGRLDGRYTGIDRDDAGERYEYDPSGAVFDFWFVSLLKDYLRRELGYENDMPFRHSTGEVRPWDYHETSNTRGYGTNSYANYAEPLREAMHQNPYLGVLVLSGYYDLATPFFATDYTIDHMQLDPTVRDNIEVAYYEAGHMMYVREKEHRKMRQDFLRFLEKILSPR